MARCSSCSAPLKPNTTTCAYCQVRNDIDWITRHKFTLNDTHSNRSCPHCQINLQTIKLNLTKPLLIERCHQCYGLFFDPGEVESLLDQSCNETTQVKQKLLNQINRDRYRTVKKIKYIKCPVCKVLMNRVNFGLYSGVVVDRCSRHGIWLDSGKIRHLIEWKTVGGAHLQSKKPPAKKNRTPAFKTDYLRSNSSDASLTQGIIETLFSLF